MADAFRFGDFVREVSLRQYQISFNDLARQGSPGRVRLRGTDVYRILQPFVRVRFVEQARAVLPLALYLMLFQIFVLRQEVENAALILAGLMGVILGLMLFLEGLKIGLMPFGEVIGNRLPVKSPLWLVLVVAFVLGVGVTFAEPAIGALKTAGSIVDAEQAPVLWSLLNRWTLPLVLVVGAGVGLAAVLGTLRFLFGWSLKPFLYATLAPALGLTAWLAADPAMGTVLGLAWDCGAVTTGPVTVPLVLALGIGVASAAGKGDSGLTGFGIVTLASLYPVVGVVGLALVVGAVEDPAEVARAAALLAAPGGGETGGWWTVSPWLEMFQGVQAIVPLVVFLYAVLRLVIRERLREAGAILSGLFLAVAGMVIFNLGLTYGLSRLGAQSGELVPAAFTGLEGVFGSPLYPAAVGIGLTLAFAWVLGFGATLAEPALNALGQTVENLTQGAFPKGRLMGAVAFGVAVGIALGVAKVIFDWNLALMVLAGYSLALVLTALSDEEFVNVAWDSAGVTTGPVTVPLVLALGLGLGGAMEAVEGFGILSMASIGPIVAVLAAGLHQRWADARRRRRQREEGEVAPLEIFNKIA